MKNYKLTIFNQSRILLVIFLFPICLLGSLFLGLKLMSKHYFWIASIPIFSGLLALMYYFAKGDLTVYFDDEILTFKWKQKLIFNYHDIEAIPAKNIKTVVIDQNQSLRRIITSDRIIKISNGKLLMKDSQEFINLLRSITIQNGGKIIDSWGVWKEQGYLKLVLIINTVIITSIIGIIMTFGIVKGFDKIPPVSFFMLIFLLPQMILYQRQMNKK